MIGGASLVRIGIACVVGVSFAAVAKADDAIEKPTKSVGGDPSCVMIPVAQSVAIDGVASAKGELEDQPGTVVRDGVAAIRMEGKPGFWVIDARWVDPTRTIGPDIEIVNCEAIESTEAEALLPEGVKVRQTGGIFGTLAQWFEGQAVGTAPKRPRRLDRGFDRKVAEPGEPGRSRAALTLNRPGYYVVLIGGTSPGTRFSVDISRGDDERPTAQPFLPITLGKIDATSTRQSVSLRPYSLHELKIEADGPVGFRGTSSVPMYLEVGDVSDDAAFDWFGLRRSATTGDEEGEVERLVLWRAEIGPDKESVFGLNLKQGSYFVRLRGRSKTSFGDYSVAMTMPKPAELLRIPDPELIKAGKTLGNLILGESFSQDADGAYQFRPTKLYQFTGKAGSGYEVRLDSAVPKELDPFLGAGGMLPVLETSTSNSQRTTSGERFFALLANNDHANVAGMHPTSSCLFFTARKNGPIVLKVIGTRVNQAGGYTLTLTETPTGCVPASKTSSR